MAVLYAVVGGVCSRPLNFPPDLVNKFFVTLQTLVTNLGSWVHVQAFLPYLALLPRILEAGTDDAYTTVTDDDGTERAVVVELSGRKMAALMGAAKSYNTLLSYFIRYDVDRAMIALKKPVINADQVKDGKINAQYTGEEESAFELALRLGTVDWRSYQSLLAVVAKKA